MSAVVDGQQALLCSTVIEGHDGFLFHRDHEAVEQVTGRFPLGPDEVAAWSGAIESRAAWCRRAGIVFRFLIVPEKHTVYDDKVPFLPISPNRPAMQIMAALPDEVRRQVIYPDELLHTKREEYETYFVTDTHWTERGAFAVYEALIATLPGGLLPTPVTEAGLGLATRRFVGDLGVRLEPEPDEIATTLFHKPPRAFNMTFHNKANSRGSTVVYEGDPNGGRMVVFRDSFFNYIIPHLIPALARTVAVSSINMHYDLLESEKPDVIVFEIAERFLGNLDGLGRRITPDDDHGVPFQDFSGADLATMRLASLIPGPDDTGAPVLL